MLPTITNDPCRYGSIYKYEMRMITSSLYNLLRMIAFSVNCSKQALHKKVGKGLPLGVTFLVAIKALENEQKLLKIFS